MRTPAEHRLIAEQLLDDLAGRALDDPAYQKLALRATAHVLAAVAACLDTPVPVSDGDDDVPLRDRLLAILEDPATPPLGLTVTELSYRAGWTKSSVRRGLRALEAERLARISGQRRGISLWCLNGPLPPDGSGIPVHGGDRPLP